MPWLRTSPMYAPEVRVGPDGTRPGGGPRLSILQPPGTYTVRLNVGGKPLTSRLEVRKDPNSGGTDADITAQTKTLTELRRMLDDAAEVVNQVELVRGQIASLRNVIQESEILQPALELDRKLVEVERNLVELRTTGRGQDGVRFGAQLLSKINYLAGGLASADFRPTNQQLEVQKGLEEKLRAHQREVDALVNKDLKAINDLMRGRGVANIVTRPK